MRKNILNIVNIVIAIAIIATIIFSIIVSQDQQHLDHCDEEHCLKCASIHIAQNIISLSIAFIIVIIIGFLIYVFLSGLNKNEITFVQLSLVSLKVQFNE